MELDKDRIEPIIDLLSDVIWWLDGYLAASNEGCANLLIGRDHINAIVDVRCKLLINRR